MQVKCPKCGQTLRVRDELLGKRIKCPKCQTVLRLKAPAPPPSGEARLADEPAAPVPPPADHAPIDLQLADEPAPLPGQAMGITPGRQPVCYLTRRSDELRAVTRIFGKMRELFPDEGLHYQFVDYDFRMAGPPTLREQDVQVTAGVDHCDYGSRTMRYLLTPLSLFFGVGACKLEVSGEVLRGDGTGAAIGMKTRQGVGLFGGSDEGLMEVNLKSVEKGFADRVAKKLTGRWITNFGARRLGKAALVCGLIGLVPVLGLIVFLPTLALGGVSLGTMVARGHKKGMWMAVVGVALGIADVAISVAILTTVD